MIRQNDARSSLTADKVHSQPAVPKPVLPKSRKIQEREMREFSPTRDAMNTGSSEKGKKNKKPSQSARSKKKDSKTVQSPIEENAGSFIGVDGSNLERPDGNSSEPSFPPQWANVVDEIRRTVKRPVSVAPTAPSKGPTNPGMPQSKVNRGYENARRKRDAGMDDSVVDSGSSSPTRGITSHDSSDDTVTVEEEMLNDRYALGDISRQDTQIRPSHFIDEVNTRFGNSGKLQGNLSPIPRPRLINNQEGSSSPSPATPREKSHLKSHLHLESHLSNQDPSYQQRAGAEFFYRNPKEWYGLGDEPGYDPNFKTSENAKTSGFLTAWQAANDMAVVKNCCGCCDIRKGVLIVALMNAFIVGAVGAYFSYVLANFYREDVYGDVRKSYDAIRSGLVDSLRVWVEGFMGTEALAVQASLRNGCIVLVSICAIYIFFALLLGYAAFVYNAWLHLPWIIAEFLVALSTLIAMGYYFYYRIGLSQVADEGQFIIQIALFCIVAGLVAYGWMAAVSHFQMLWSMDKKMTPVEPMDGYDPDTPYDLQQRKMAAGKNSSAHLQDVGESDLVSQPVEPFAISPAGHLHTYDYDNAPMSPKRPGTSGSRHYAAE